MKKNVSAIYPQDQSLKSYQDAKSRLLQEGNTYLQATIESLREIAWVYDERLIGKIIFPSIAHAFSIYSGLYFVLKGYTDEDILLSRFLTDDDNDYIKQILIQSIASRNKAMQSEKNSCTDKEQSEKRQKIEDLLALSGTDGKITLIKGSIYKIKRYFLENNSIKDIRGGSIIVDYLNNEMISHYLDEEESQLNKSCLIYSGGGNILLMAPKGEGARICEALEKKCYDQALTVMNAFEYIERDVYQLLFEFEEVMRYLDEKLKERTKSKIYYFDPKPEGLDTLCIQGESVSFDLKQVSDGKICSLCNIREGCYEYQEDSEIHHICSSCMIKNRVGKQIKSKHFRDYANHLKTHYIKDQIINQIYKQDTEAQTGDQIYEKVKKNAIKETLDDLKDDQGMIAVLYGDGNNMGNIVKNISAPYEMMYFSHRTDQITKASVYSAIYEVMGENAAFEMLAVGGDDLFFIVPAVYAPRLAVRIVELFDKAFNQGNIADKEKTTMSVGICIGKYNMPIKSMFEIAQSSLKKAKQMVRERIMDKEQRAVEDPIEGTIDIVEVSGAQTILNLQDKQGIFPMGASRLQKVLDELENMKDAKARLYDYSYAQKTMITDEFRLYFNYKEAQLKKHNKEGMSMTSLLQKAFGKNANIQLQRAIGENEEVGATSNQINYFPKEAGLWSDLLLLIKYRGGVK